MENKDKYLYDYLKWAFKEGEKILITPNDLGFVFHDLYAKGLNKDGILTTINIIITTDYRYGIVRVTEIYGFDPKEKVILTNELFRYLPQTDEYEFSGKSYLLEKSMLKYNIKKEEIMEKVFGK